MFAIVFNVLILQTKESYKKVSDNKFQMHGGGLYCNKLLTSLLRRLSWIFHVAGTLVVRYNIFPMHYKASSNYVFY